MTFIKECYLSIKLTSLRSPLREIQVSKYWLVHYHKMNILQFIIFLILLTIQELIRRQSRDQSLYPAWLDQYTCLSVETFLFIKLTKMLDTVNLWHNDTQGVDDIQGVNCNCLGKLPLVLAMLFDCVLLAQFAFYIWFY